MFKKVMFLFFILFIATLLFVSCSGNSSVTDNGSNTNEISEITEILEPNTNSNVESFSHETGTLVFEENANVEDIEVGEIVVGGVSDAAPEGFLRKVVSKREENGKTIFETEQATITEAIKNCSYSGTIPLDSLEPDSVWYADGVKRGKDKSKLGINVDVSVVFYDQDGDSSTLNDQVKLEGNFKAGIDLNLDFNIDFFSLERFEISTSLTRETNLLATIGMVKNFTPIDKDIVRYFYPPITVPTVVPIVVVPSITLTAKADGSISAKASYGIVSTEENMVGALYEDDNWSKISSHTDNFDYNSIEVEGNFEFKAGVGIELKTKIYGVVGPAIGVDAYGKASAEATITPTSMDIGYVLKVGADLHISAVLEVFSHNFLEYTLGWNIFEKVLLEDSFVLSYIPEAIISTPLDNSYFPYGANINFTGYGEDPQDGTITENIVWKSNIDGYLGSGTPLNINNLSLGEHNITMTVTDNDGYSDDATISVEITGDGNTPPMVNITSPSNGSAFTIGDIVNIEATAEDNGSVESVKLYANNELLTTLTSFPFNYDWNTANLNEGSCTLKAIATDNEGLTGESEEITITLSSQNTSPMVSITSPSNGSFFTIGDIVNIEATAEDNGSVESVKLYANNELLTTLTSFPFNYDWNTANLNEGSCTLKAIATDNEGLTGESEEVTITLNEQNTPNIITITSPINGDTFTIGDTISIVTSVQNNSNIESVKIYANNQLLSILTTLPFTHNWDTANLEIGNYNLKAVAKDNQGVSFESEEITITLENEIVNRDFVFVESGSFSMGDHFNEGEGDELPVHSLAINSFFISKYEVTQKLYVSIMGNNPSYFPGEDRPVEQVSWFDAVEFCNKLSELEGLEKCYNLSDSIISCDLTKNGYRLPTEAEWEYAARGGVSHTDDFRYSGCHQNSELGDYAWYKGNSGSKTHDVGTKLPNQLGIYDMSGNVWEWCNDWYSSTYYATLPSNNPQGPESGTKRVGRGGGWGNAPSGCRVANRSDYAPTGSDRYLGFRLVCSVVR